MISIDRFRKYFPDDTHDLFPTGREYALSKMNLMTKIEELEGVKTSDHMFSKLVGLFTPQGRIVVIKHNEMTRTEKEKRGNSNLLYSYRDDSPMDGELSEEYTGQQLWELKPSSYLSDFIRLPIPTDVESPDVRIGLYRSVINQEGKEWERFQGAFPICRYFRTRNLSS